MTKTAKPVVKKTKPKVEVISGGKILDFTSSTKGGTISITLKEAITLPPEPPVQEILLSICIPTIVGRETQFDRLYSWLQSKAQPWMEFIVEKDNKEISIGAKRDLMLSKCKGKYFVMIDDDDAVAEDYFEEIYPALLGGADCVGHLEHCFMDGKDKTSIFSLMFKEWRDNFGGYDFVRTPFYKSPMKTAIAQQIGFEDIRFAEDHKFAIKVYPLLKSEFFIKKVLYYYQPVFKAGENRYGK